MAQFTQAKPGTGKVAPDKFRGALAAAFITYLGEFPKMKTIAALITAFLVSATLLVVSAPANAAVYPKSIGVVCAAKAVKPSVLRTSRPGVAYSASAEAGNAKPTGKVTFTFTRQATGKVVRKATRAYNGGQAVYRFKRFRRGNLVITASLDTGANSVFKNCVTTAAQNVR